MQARRDLAKSGQRCPPAYRTAAPARSQGELWCWGSDSYGQLGTPTSASPVRLLDGESATTAALIRIEAHTSCAIATARVSGAGERLVPRSDTRNGGPLNQPGRRFVKR
ncbi:RCC1 domain-containing protein [Actinoplanes sp. NPDC023801]|uniref:RCC1 domain-containing protein n=1 Tax=Actinoplanes sp. NPDC023801 TaxID=3154595 RepID=UPI0033E00370